ncbi:MAG TPA: hypothetical protein VL096_00525 [Pirellulaceae bacterium]|nr:hypothetical protein [Pirellulaceae bacterium]
MNSPNRATLIAKLQKVLKKHYKQVVTPERTLLEHLLYACCLENASFEHADEAFAQLQQAYFDWNEVRVTSSTELAEVFGSLPQPQLAATRIKKILQGMFDVIYDFDLEPLKKQNLGKAIKDLERFGATPFALAYVTQHGLGGHAIAADEGTFDVLVVLGIISESEAAKELLPGLERAVPKNKGEEFFSELHQLSAEFLATPSSSKMRSLLTEIAPDAKERIAARLSRKEVFAGEAKAAARKERIAAREAAAKEAAALEQPSKHVPPKPDAKGKPGGKPAPAVEAEKPKPAPPAPAVKKPVKVETPEPPKKKPIDIAKPTEAKKKAEEPSKKPGLKGLVKKKPR